MGQRGKCMSLIGLALLLTCLAQVAAGLSEFATDTPLSHGSRQLLAPLPSPPTSLSECPQDLKNGLRNSGCVVRLQQLLNSWGVKPALDVDAWFGPKTQAGLKSFQKAKGLRVTGVADSETKAALETIVAPPISLSKCANSKFGNVNGCVFRLQQLLNTWGAKPALQVDGWFGPKTQAAVKTYQKAKKLPVTGVVDSKMRALLEQLVSPPVSLFSCGTVKIGDVNGCAYRLQQLLNTFGTKPALDVDGYFGPITLGALKAFQKVKGLTVSGVADSKTKSLLETFVHPPASLSKCGKIKIGDVNGCAFRLQQLLNAYGTKPALAVDGYFGPITQGALKAFQKAQKLLVTGVADTKTKALLETLVTPPASLSACSNIKFGDVNGCAFRLQLLLNAWGTKPALVVDGWFGPNTQAAVKAYQKAKGWKVTGVADSQVKAALEKLVAPPKSLLQCSNIAIGQVNGCAYRLQQLLNSWGVKPKLLVDGWFGPVTQAAVKSYQKAKGWKVTGVVDAGMRKALEGK